MTADEARKIEGMFGCIQGTEDKKNYPVTLYGTVVKSDGYWLLFESTEDELGLFSLRKVQSFTARAKKRYLKLIKVKRYPGKDENILVGK